MSQSNGKPWGLISFSLFKDQLIKLVDEVENIKNNQPEKFRSHPKFILLQGIQKCITSDIPNNPNHRRFLLGNTLGSRYKHFRRAKRLLPNRYRLFFIFNSRVKEIIYIWLNDPSTLRKAGARTDVYAVFKKKLDAHAIPDTFEGLKEQSSQLNLSS
ncbi:MAG: type II toxin-antitoxin system YhaV family toxin [Desulfobacterales bacterium]|nr:type II toxin-antitoxin system YhaV family toxin [Desulfobacterales bacterium]MDD4070846.1 type II toxin-antitoxin system YhaV family toxin [Desulfobacterales bacterium]MDD4391249.1 type II toxin-antitoxin system YhaV family toxin [Desulfobacterales bacterium]